MRELMRGARAFVFAAEEDFGILPVEAQACGTPVIAFGRGGVLETVRAVPADRPTGTFFAEQTPQAVADAIRGFESIVPAIDPGDCRENAERFGTTRFIAAYTGFVARAHDEFGRSGR